MPARFEPQCEPFLTFELLCGAQTFGAVSSCIPFAPWQKPRLMTSQHGPSLHGCFVDNVETINKCPCRNTSAHVKGPPQNRNRTNKNGWPAWLVRRILLCENRDENAVFHKQTGAHNGNYQESDQNPENTRKITVAAIPQSPGSVGAKPKMMRFSGPQRGRNQRRYRRYLVFSSHVRGLVMRRLLAAISGRVR